METSTNTKVEVVKPILLKAGIPLAITVAGFIFARLTTRKGSILQASSAENQANSPEGDSHEKHRDEGISSILESLASSSSCCAEDSHSSMGEASHQNLEVMLLDQHKDELEEEILGLRNRVQDLQERELELETRFLLYNHMKEQELVLMDLQNKLLLEISKVEFLDKEISLVEAERQRCEDMVFEYLKITERLDISISENRLLRRRVKKLLRKAKEQSGVIKEQCLQMEAKEAEISRNYEELEKMANVISKMEEEIKQLKMAMDRMQIENNGLLNQIELANKAASSKMEAEEATKSDYGSLLNKLEELEKERTSEVKELIYLRWCNACLRHELLRRNQEEQDQRAEKDQMELNCGEIAHFGSDNELDYSSFRHGNSCLGFPNTGHARAHSKRRRFIQKFKRWMEGREKTKQQFNENEKHEIKYFERHSVLDGAIDLHIPARKSYSSA